MCKGIISVLLLPSILSMALNVNSEQQYVCWSQVVTYLPSYSTETAIFDSIQNNLSYKITSAYNNYNKYTSFLSGCEYGSCSAYQSSISNKLDSHQTIIDSLPIYTRKELTKSIKYFDNVIDQELDSLVNRFSQSINSPVAILHDCDSLTGNEINVGSDFILFLQRL